MGVATYLALFLTEDVPHFHMRGRLQLLIGSRCSAAEYIPLKVI